MDTAKFIDELVRDESDKGHPYFDCGHHSVLTCPECGKGILTVGIGRNLRDVELSHDERFRMLHNDIERTIAALDQHLPWWKNLTEPRQRVLANMAFNMGCSVGPSGKLHGLLTFHHTLALIQAGRFREAADEMLLSKWASQVGERATRLADAMRGDTVPA